MSAFLTHFRIRFFAVVTDPYALIVFVLTGAASLMYWPGLIERSEVMDGLITRGEGLNPGFLMLIWIFIWPMLGGSLAGGSVAGGGREAMAQRPLPSLPVGLRTRVLAESLLILLFAFLARVPSFVLGEFVHRNLYLPGLLDEAQYAMDIFVQRSWLGAVIILPSVLIWTAPARSVQVYFMVRPLVLTALYMLAMLSGLMASVIPCVLFSLALSGLFLVFLDREIALPAFQKTKAQPVEKRWRPGMHPHARLYRDLWTKPLPAAALLIFLEAVLVAIDYVYTLPKYGLYMGSCFVFGFMFSLVALRPMGIYFVETAFSGKCGSPKSGDPGRAWMILPVRFSSMTRGIYLHGLITGALLWLGVLLVNGASTYMSFGEFAFRDIDGDTAGKYLVPFLSVVPCLAGGVTCLAVGDRLRSYISMAAAFGIFVSHVAMLIAKVPTPLRAAVLVGFALLGGVPALTYLRKNQDRSFEYDSEPFNAAAPGRMNKGTNQ